MTVTYKCNRCGPHNLPTPVPGKVHRYDDPDPGAWQAFIDAMCSGERFECDEEMYYYWLEVLPPVFMHREITFLPGHEGHLMRVDFGFAEGAEPVTVFWRSPDRTRFFGQRTTFMNPYG